MKLIIIRGKKDSGKTTISSLVCRELIEKKAKKICCEELNKSALIGNKAWDFASVLDIKGKIVVIISRGDYYDKLKEDMEKYIRDKNPDIMLVCAGLTSHKTYDMLNQEFKNYMNDRKEFSPKYLDEYNDKNEMIEAKKETAQEIAKYIIDEISKQNEN